MLYKLKTSVQRTKIALVSQFMSDCLKRKWDDIKHAASDLMSDLTVDSAYPHAHFNWRHSKNIYSNKITAGVTVSAISNNNVTAGTNAI